MLYLFFLRNWKKAALPLAYSSRFISVHLAREGVAAVPLPKRRHHASLCEANWV